MPESADGRTARLANPVFAMTDIFEPPKCAGPIKQPLSRRLLRSPSVGIEVWGAFAGVGAAWTSINRPADHSSYNHLINEEASHSPPGDADRANEPLRSHRCGQRPTFSRKGQRNLKSLQCPFRQQIHPGTKEIPFIVARGQSALLRCLQQRPFQHRQTGSDPIFRFDSEIIRQTTSDPKVA